MRLSRSHAKAAQSQTGEFVFEVKLTPGEKLQNWLAARGIGVHVQPRDMDDPPSGLWSLVNGAITIVLLGTFVAVIGLVVFDVIPTLMRVNTF